MTDIKTKTKVRVQSPIRRLAENKKAIIAFGLIAVMALMWGRILLKKSPTQAAAASPAQPIAAEQPVPKVKITFQELPRIKGRNDILTRDMFAGSKWEGMGAAANGARQSNEITNGHEQTSDTIKTIGKELKLEALSSGKNPQAYISGVLVSPKGILTLRHEGEKYEFKVVAMNESGVVLECNGTQVKLSMARPADSAD